VGADGVTPIGNGVQGVSLASATSSVIGGEHSPAHRNVISGNNSNEVSVDSSFSEPEGKNVIVNNYIGTTANGLGARGNESAIHVSAPAQNGDISIVGGAGPLARKVVSGIKRYGVRLWSTENDQVLGNFIGTRRDGLTPLPKGWDGVAQSFGAAKNTVGSIAPDEGKLLAYKGDSVCFALHHHCGGLYERAIISMLR
jgi:hypothetical protein